MNEKLDLNTKNMITVMFMQALLGVISPNFRRVALKFDELAWDLSFVLEANDATDRDEIKDAVDEFSCLLSDININNVKLKTEIIINPEPLCVLDSIEYRTVFRRREVN